MSVLATTSSVSYTGTGAVKTYPLPFPVLEAAHLVATRTVAGVPTVLVQGPDYTVNVGAGTVTLAANLAAGATLLLERTLPLTQGVDFNTYGPFSPEVHEAALDALTMVAQQEARERLKVATRVSAIEAGGAGELDIRLDGIEANVSGVQTAATSLDARLDSLEPTVSGHTATLSGHTSTLSSHTTTLSGYGTRIGALESGAVDVSRVTALEAWRGTVGGTALAGSLPVDFGLSPSEYKVFVVDVPGVAFGARVLVCFDVPVPASLMHSAAVVVAGASGKVRLTLFNADRTGSITGTANATVRVLQ